MAQGTGGAGSERTIEDGAALDEIAAILADPEWGAGMLEDIAQVIERTGRSLANPTGAATWQRH